jgi:peptidoglycan/xylan/chitin deacetylase (PgdA/CDA1 family)
MKFSALLFLALGLVACSTPKHQPATEVASTASDRVARAISSELDEEALERTYQRLAESQDPSKDMGEYFGRLAAIYFRTEGLLKDYDKHLDALYQNKEQSQISELLTHDSYARLITAWILRERMIGKIRFIYRRNVENMFNRGDNSPADRQRRDRALAINLAFKRAIKKYSSDENKLAMQSLYQVLIAELQEYRAERKLERAGSVGREENVLGKNLFDTNREQDRFVQQNRKAIEQQVAVASKDEVVNEELNQLQGDVKQHLEEQFDQGREPKAVGDVVPSSGSKGNLTGNSFKAGRWALTYDDGPSAKHTSKILDNLEERGMKATFFWLSQLTPNYPTMINRAKDLGMALANHSHSHANLPKLGPQGLNREIVQSTATHTRVYGHAPVAFRCPYGACGGNGSNIRTLIANQNNVHIFWNIDSLDWQDKNAQSIYNRVTKAMGVAKKGIILFHDIHPQSVESTRMLMDAWKPEISAGRMRLLTIPEAISELNSPNGMQ